MILKYFNKSIYFFLIINLFIFLNCSNDDNEYSCSPKYEVPVTGNVISAKLSDAEKGGLIEKTYTKILGTWKGKLINLYTSEEYNITFEFTKRLGANAIINVLGKASNGSVKPVCSGRQSVIVPISAKVESDIIEANAETLKGGFEHVFYDNYDEYILMFGESEQNSQYVWGGYGFGSREENKIYFGGINQGQGPDKGIEINGALHSLEIKKVEEAENDGVIKDLGGCYADKLCGTLILPDAYNGPSTPENSILYVCVDDDEDISNGCGGALFSNKLNQAAEELDYSFNKDIPVGAYTVFIFIDTDASGFEAGPNEGDFVNTMKAEILVTEEDSIYINDINLCPIDDNGIVDDCSENYSNENANCNDNICTETSTVN